MIANFSLNLPYKLLLQRGVLLNSASQRGFAACLPASKTGLFRNSQIRGAIRRARRNRLEFVRAAPSTGPKFVLWAQAAAAATCLDIQNTENEWALAEIIE